MAFNRTVPPTEKKPTMDSDQMRENMLTSFFQSSLRSDNNNTTVPSEIASAHSIAHALDCEQNELTSPRSQIKRKQLHPIHTRKASSIDYIEDLDAE